MSLTQQQAAGRSSYLKHGRDTCPCCGGSGSITNADWRARARKGGNAAVEASKQPGQMSMRDRGRLGGSPRLPTWEDLANPRPARPSHKTSAAVPT